MQEIRSSNPPVVTRICDPNKSRTRHHRNKKFIKNKKIFKSQQRLKSERHNDFAEKINKISLSSNDDKRIQSIDPVETCAYGAKKN